MMNTDVLQLSLACMDLQDASPLDMPAWNGAGCQCEKQRQRMRTLHSPLPTFLKKTFLQQLDLADVMLLLLLAL